MVVLSLRLDRIDNFWFVLRHEIEHVLLNHGRDRGFIVGTSVMNHWSRSTRKSGWPMRLRWRSVLIRRLLISSLPKLGLMLPKGRRWHWQQAFGVHPGLLVGQLQRRLRRYDLLRKHQVKVRELVVRSARTDGWGV